MLSAYLGEQWIQAFEVKNKYGNYMPEKVEELKRAGVKGELKCPDCGTDLILKAGDINIPHFAHKRVSPSCYFSKRSGESKEHLLGKLILYSYFKSQASVEAVYADRRVTEKRFANIVVEQKGQSVALEVIRHTDYKGYFEKVDEYQKSNLMTYWILSYKDFVFEKNHELLLFMRFVEKYDIENIIRLIDTVNETLVLRKYFDLMDGETIVETIEYTESYLLKDVAFSEEGYFITAFLEAFEERKALGIHQFRLEKERKRKAFLEKKLEQEIMDQMDADISVPKYKYQAESGSGNKQTFEERQAQVLDLISINPDGPWIDSDNVRWGICEECGQILEKDRFKYYRGKDSKGVCDECE